MPIEILYIIALLAVVCISFLLLKQPIYESMLYGYVAMIVITGQYENFFTYIAETSTDSLFYAIIAFLVLSKILDMTHAIDTVINLIISIFGRIRGGAAYAAVIASTFMGALSGSGPGNVATTGVFTIPAMKKSGIPAHLAANIESSSSVMGNMIPPSGNILIALACYNEFMKTEMSQSAFWIATWGVSLWFILQRIVTVFIFCRYYKVKPMEPEAIPSFMETIKTGWKNLLLPVIIILPFIIEYFFKSGFITDRLGAGAGNFSSSLLLFAPGITAIYALIVNRKKCSIKQVITNLKSSVSGIASIGATIFFSYCISNLFASTDIGYVIGTYVQSFNMPIVALAIIIPFVILILGMVLPGSAISKIFGVTVISIFASAGINPLLTATMLPVITGAMAGMTPPLALAVYTAMGIAESGMKETTINAFIWAGIHYLLSVICLLGFLPILGI